MINQFFCLTRQAPWLTKFFSAPLKYPHLTPVTPVFGSAARPLTGKLAYSAKQILFSRARGEPKWGGDMMICHFFLASGYLGIRFLQKFCERHGNLGFSSSIARQVVAFCNSIISSCILIFVSFAICFALWFAPPKCSVRLTDRRIFLNGLVCQRDFGFFLSIPPINHPLP